MKEGVVKIRAFRAMDDVRSSEKFVEGHQKVLAAHGVKKVTSLNLEWISNPAVFVINVESADGKKVYGGARVQAAGGTSRLPIEEATGYMDNKVYDEVEKQSIHGTGELCGLWNSVEVAGLGIGSFFATRAGVTLCSQIGIDSLFALCAPYTVRWAERVGCKVLSHLGNDGTFYYPKLDLLATATLLHDTTTMVNARPVERQKVFNLRNNPKQILAENPPGKRFEVEIDYDLFLPTANPKEFKSPIMPAIKNAENFPSI